MKKILSVLLISLLAISLIAGCGGGTATPNNPDNSVAPAPGTNAGSDAKPDGVKKEVFRVGMEADYPPFNWTQLDASNGAVPIQGQAEFAGGYDVEIAKRIAEGLGRELVVVKIAWEGLVPSLQTDKIDGIIAGMSPTEERKESIDFSDNYYKSDLVIVVKKDSPYLGATSIQDFADARITAQLNTFHYTVIDQIKGINMIPAMDNFSAMRVALEAGKIDGYVSERPEGISVSAANDNLTFVDFTPENGFATDDDDTAIAVGLLKNSPLKDDINAILAKISLEEQIEIMNDAIINQPAGE